MKDNSLLRALTAYRKANLTVAERQAKGMTREQMQLTSEELEAVADVKIHLIKVRVQARIALAEALQRYGKAILSSGLGDEHQAIETPAQHFAKVGSLEGLNDELVFWALSWLVDHGILDSDELSPWLQAVEIFSKEPLFYPFIMKGKEGTV